MAHRDRWCSRPRRPDRHANRARRQGILVDCRAHKIDVESHNDNNTFQVRLPLFSYDFNPDLAEIEMPTDYPDEKP
jgi:hypothetical protein